MKKSGGEHKREQFLKKAGMTFFLIASAMFVVLTFAINISLEDSDLEGLLKPEHQELANRIGKLPPAPPVVMSSRLSKTFNEYNKDIVNQKGVSDVAADKFIESLSGNPENFTKDLIDEQFAEDPWLNEQIEEYTGWMRDNQWRGFEDFKSTLRGKFSDVNNAVSIKYGVAGDAGNLQLQVMKSGAPHWLKTGWMGLLIIGLGALGGLIYGLPFAFKKPGIHNNHIFHTKAQNRKYPGIVLFVILIAFYIVLYEFPTYLANQIVLLDPVSRALAGNASDRWFLYGVLYSVSMVVMGVRMMFKYRGNPHQQVRTVSVMFFQVVFAFTLPQIMTALQMPAYDLKSAWPLEYSFFFDYRIDQYLSQGTLGIFLLFWGIALFAIGVPLFTYFCGKRWYCSWVCGCGGLAETVGDPYRQLSDKRLVAWKIERWLVNGVWVFAVFMTVWVAYTSFTGQASLLGVSSYAVRHVYGFAIGFVFAGAVGVGFYPLMGNRVWCRFGCPLAAYLGFVQRFKSRFRITTNGGQCISCGNCSTYCEMGIDVRWYAQRGQNIVRSSCVGCGICASVCPRGVLKLENTGEKGRINDNPILIGRDGATLNL